MSKRSGSGSTSSARRRAPTGRAPTAARGRPAAPRSRSESAARSTPSTRRAARASAKDPIAELQRARMLAAMATACRDLSAGRVSVTDVVSRAGVSRRTFYELFEDREDCLTAALEEGLRRAAAAVVPAYREQSDWRAAIRAGLDAFLAFLDFDRTFGTLLVIDSLAAGDRALHRRAEILARVARAVEGGRRFARARDSLGRDTAEGVVGAVLAILHARLLAAPERPVQPLAGALTAMVVLPYLGTAAAAREAKRKPAGRVTVARDGDPIAEIGMRMTHRTLMVLQAIAADPGASNREVADAAGIVDQGQVSKLLARLVHLGLIANLHIKAREQGEANAWQLTPLGERVVRATTR